MSPKGLPSNRGVPGFEAWKQNKGNSKNWNRVMVHPVVEELSGDVIANHSLCVGRLCMLNPTFLTKRPEHPEGVGL